jgi:hypothetical protein
MVEKRSPAPWMVVLVLLLAPGLYVLSIGPVAMIYHGSEAPRWLIAIYQPLLLVAERIPVLQPVLTWYLNLWTG